MKDDVISRQAAIDAVKHAWAKGLEPSQYIEELPSAQPEPCEDDPRADVYYLAEKIGINRLYTLVVALRGEPESCEDTISRQAAIDALDVLCQEHRYKIPGKSETYSQYNEAWQDALDRAEGAIFNLPSAQPERKTGKWIEVDDYYNCISGRCSVCGWESHLYEDDVVGMNFCPNCGADMRGEQNK